MRENVEDWVTSSMDAEPKVAVWVAVWVVVTLAVCVVVAGGLDSESDVVWDACDTVRSSVGVGRDGVSLGESVGVPLGCPGLGDDDGVVVALVSRVDERVASSVPVSVGSNVVVSVSRIVVDAEASNEGDSVCESMDTECCCDTDGDAVCVGTLVTLGEAVFFSPPYTAAVLLLVRSSENVALTV